MSFSADCEDLFGSKDLYIILQVKKTAKPAELKKAYYKQSILWHPDRFAASLDEEEKLLATRKFQVISKAYEILSDTEKRRIYDATGSTNDEDFSSTNWAQIWRTMFKKVTPEEIEEYLRKFRGSQQEMEDIKKQYVKHRGDMNKILESVIGADVENEDRIREVIRYYIELGEVTAYPKFVNEPPSKRIKRLERAEREAKAAEKMTAQLASSNQENFDLVSAIQNRGQKHAAMIDELEKKYAPKPKRAARAKKT